ncbi:MAG: cytochrome b N-terminal domain-containing protein [Candidatus Lindowbacteria bacterium]|nr:cytochrome b N-terminal domain-containing protein [Candidatus Lindowbacteria bacterium]
MAESTDNSKSALRIFAENLKESPARLRESLFRHDWPNTDRTRSQAVFANFFLHLHSTRIHERTLRFRSTCGVGLAALACFVLLTVTGILLMVYYKAGTDLAYQSIKDITFVVPTGQFIRNIHRWSAHLMVVFVLLHMARVFYTASYKSPREFNWLVGMALLVLTLGLSFTGYLLPWDQLAYWAITIGSNIAQSPREITDAIGITRFFDPGGLQKRLLLGADIVGQEALTRFYLLHVIALPLVVAALIGVHFWRVRKDGGLARPDDEPGTPVRLLTGQTVSFSPAPEKTYGLMALVRGKTPQVDRGPEHTITAWPNAFYAEMAVLMATCAACLVLALIADAPLKEIANPNVPENPAKAPWYFLGLQELVSYSAFMGGIGIPTLVLLGLGMIPFLDREEGAGGVWPTSLTHRGLIGGSAIFSAFVVVALLAFTVRFGWLRNWFPHIPQLVIVAINPGTVLVALFAEFSLYIMNRYNSTRAGAVALFTCFIVAFVILTYVATVHRGPNWNFYWSRSQWPIH